MGVDLHERTGDPTIDWTQVKVPNDIDRAFPANVIDVYLPPYDYIPKVFQDESHPYCRLVSQAFYRGLGAGTKMSPREGINPEEALKQIQACLGSFQPAHEHKIRGVAYLMNCFFSKVVSEDGTVFEGTDVESVPARS